MKTPTTKPAAAPIRKKVGSVEELASIVGRHVRTIQRHAKNPDAPRPDKRGRHDVNAWVRYLAANGRDANPTDPELIALKTRRLLAEVQTREHRLATLRGEYVPMEEVRTTWTELLTQATAMLRKKFEHELPPIMVGLDATAIQAEASKALDDVLAILHAGD